MTGRALPPRWAPFEPDRNLDRAGTAALRMRDDQAVAEFPREVRIASRSSLLAGRPMGPMVGTGRPEERFRAG